MMTQTSTVSRIRTLVSVLVLVAFALAPGSAFGLRINGPGDAALAGALVQNFDSEAAGTYFTNQTFDASNNLLGTYVISSQSPGLTGFARQGYFGATEASRIQRFTVRSAGNDRALIDDFLYVVNRVPEPNVAILLCLGFLTLAGTRIRDLQPGLPIRTDRE